jgi:hypothetical protein
LLFVFVCNIVVVWYFVCNAWSCAANISLYVYLFIFVSYMFCPLFFVISVCIFCCFYYGPLGCWLGRLMKTNWIELSWIIIGNVALVLPPVRCKVVLHFHSANFQAIRRNKMLDPIVLGPEGRANISSPCSCPKFYHIAGEYRPSICGVEPLIYE